jgi:hypothetical protein
MAGRLSMMPEVRNRKPCTPVEPSGSSEIHRLVCSNNVVLARLQGLMVKKLSLNARGRAAEV